MASNPIVPVILVVLVFAGCGGSGQDAPVPPNDGDTNGADTGSDASGDAGGDTGSVPVENLLFPAAVPDADSLSLSVGRTLDGIPLRDDRFGGRQFSLPVRDVDGDGRADYAFLAPAGLVSDCKAGVLLPSASLPSAELVTPDLQRSLLIVYGSGTECRHAELMSVIGDVNGDDSMDVAVYFEPLTIGDLGTAAVVFGGLVEGPVDVLTLNGQNGFMLDGLQLTYFQNYLAVLASYGDLNGDGIDDIVFNDLGLSAPPAWRWIPGRASFPARRSVADIDVSEFLLSLQPQSSIGAAGDLDGNGADDVIVGSRVDAGPRVVYGRSEESGTLFAEGVELVRDCTAGAFCEAAAAGDVDADGFDDLIVTHAFGTSGCGYGARTAVFYGGSAGVISIDTLDDRPNPSMTRILEGVANPCATGGGFGTVGDIDGDGASDYAVFGSRDGIVFGQAGVRPAVVWLDELDGSIGIRLDNVSDFYLIDGPLDVDGDGYDDLVFDDETVFQGRERRLDPNGPTEFGVERGPAYMAAAWQPSELADAARYRLELGDRLIAEFEVGVTEHVFDPLDGEAAELVLSVLSADGVVLGQSVRRVPAFDPLESLTSIIYAPRLVQVSFPGDFNIRRYGRYLVWRDGVPLGRAPDGAYDYVDNTVEPASTYRYFVTPDYLPPGSLNPDDTRDGPLLRRRSATIELTTPSG